MRGWLVVPQIGVSGFRIDLGVKHPDKPGAYLAGVECDGATYHRSAAARDRDKTRQAVLEGLGWKILRVWSPDWWHDPVGCTERLNEQLQELLEQDRSSVEPNVELEDSSEYEEVASTDQTDKDELKTENPNDDLEMASSTEPDLPALTKVHSLIRGLNAPESQDNPRPDQWITRIEALELPDYSTNADRFFDQDYLPILHLLAKEILNSQAPIREDIVAQQIARSHGFGRTGAKIRDRISMVLEGFPATDESSGRFLWPADSKVEPVIPYRAADSSVDQRPVDQIAIAELRGLVRANIDIQNDSDPALTLARRININRLSQSARERLAEAIELEDREAD